jgi:hypothetical protein
MKAIPVLIKLFLNSWNCSSALRSGKHTSIFLLAIVFRRLLNANTERPMPFPKTSRIGNGNAVISLHNKKPNQIGQ